MPLIAITPPTVAWPMETDGNFHPSWDTVESGRAIEQSASFQEESFPWTHRMKRVETRKLYEAAYHNGAVILEVGEGGPREDAVMLRAALQGVATGTGHRVPQLYHVGIAAKQILRTEEAMRAVSLADHVMFFEGGLGPFLRQVPVVPTLVVIHECVSHAAVWAQLHELSNLLTAGTPVVCAGCGGEGMRAIAEWMAAGVYAGMGRFGDAVLLAATKRCDGAVRELPAEAFADVREALLREYREAEEKGTHAAKRRIGDATSAARYSALESAQQEGGYGTRGWPFEKSASEGLPDCLPDGSPWPKISIVTPSFNYGRFLEATILSVLHQGYPRLEYLVMDGGSTDESTAVIEKYRDRLAYAVSAPDGGQSDAINKGFARATGEIFTWLNADDMLAPGALHAMAMAFWYSKADVVAGVCERYRDGRLLEKHVTCCAEGPLPLEELLDVEGSWVSGQFFVQPEVMFTRAMWEKAGGHVKESLTYSMDYDMWLRFARAGARLHVIGRSIALFRHHREQKTAVAETFMPELLGVRDDFLANHAVVVKAKSVIDRPRYQVRVASLHDPVFRSGIGRGQTRLDETLCLGGHEVHRFSIRGEETGEAIDAAVVLKGVESVSPDLVLIGTLGGFGLTQEWVAGCAARWPTCVVLHDSDALRSEQTGEVFPSPFSPMLAPRKIRECWESTYASRGSSTPPVLLANSEWTAIFATEALAAGRDSNSAAIPPVFTILYGVDVDTLRPLPQKFCRREWGLPIDSFLILTTAQSLDEAPGGIRLLAAALHKLMLPDLWVVCLGVADEGMRKAFPSLVSLGEVTGADQRATVYSAVDVVVGVEGDEAFAFQQMLTEAAACGTPSLGVPLGGMNESIIDGVTGRIAATVSAEALSWEIYSLYHDSSRRRDIGKWARIFAENEWSPQMAYQRMLSALLQSGNLPRLRMPPKISLLPEAAPLVPPVDLALHRGEWQPVSGFQSWQGPYPEQGLPRCRWLSGAVSVFQVRVTYPGVHRLRLVCSTFHAQAVIRVVQGGKLIAESAVPPFVAGTAGCELSCVLELNERSEPVELHHWPWQEDAMRGESILLFELTVTGPDGVTLPSEERAVTASASGG